MIIRYEKRKPRLEIIPMIDVMLFLVMFFMIFATFKKDQAGIEVNLPAAVSAQALSKDFLVITMAKNGRIYLNEAEVALEHLGERLKQEDTDKKRVVIKPDQEITYASLVQVMDILRENEIYNTSLAVERAQGKKDGK